MYNSGFKSKRVQVNMSLAGMKLMKLSYWVKALTIGGSVFVWRVQIVCKVCRWARDRGVLPDAFFLSAENGVEPEEFSLTLQATPPPRVS